MLVKPQTKVKMYNTSLRSLGTPFFSLKCTKYIQKESAKVTNKNETPWKFSNMAEPEFSCVFCTRALRKNIVIQADPNKNLEAVFLILIERPEPNIRAQAAACLGLIHAQASEPALANLLAGDPESTVRVSAAYALGELGNPTAIGVLVRALTDPSKLTAGTARASLAKIYGEDFFLCTL